MGIGKAKPCSLILHVMDSLHVIVRGLLLNRSQPAKHIDIMKNSKNFPSWLAFKSGGPDWTRTSDPAINITYFGSFVKHLL